MRGHLHALRRKHFGIFRARRYSCKPLAQLGGPNMAFSRSCGYGILVIGSGCSRNPSPRSLADRCCSLRPISEYSASCWMLPRSRSGQSSKCMCGTTLGRASVYAGRSRFRGEAPTRPVAEAVCLFAAAALATLASAACLPLLAFSPAGRPFKRCQRVATGDRG